MIVVFDTNIWFAELGLRSPSGAAVRFFLARKNAHVALPEVVRLEVEHNLRNRLKEFVSRIQENHRQLLTVFGRLKEVVLPGDQEIEERVSGVFDIFTGKLIDIPFSLASARSSFIRTIDKIPPSDRDQQFKDGVLWADCLSLLKDDDVILVSADKAFYQNRNYSDGLATSLTAEIMHEPRKFTLLPSLKELLSEIRVDIPLDDNLLTNAFFMEYSESITGMVNRNGFELGDPLFVSRSLYATENADLLFLKFSMQYNCLDISETGRHSAVLSLKGDGIYNALADQFQQLRNFGEELKFSFEDGTLKEVRNVVIFADGITLGHKEVVNTIRYPLD